jgi:amidase
MTDIDSLYRQADAVELADHVRSGAVQASELAEAAIRVIEALNPHLNAVVDKRYDIGRAASVEWGATLAGVPFVIKDLGLSWAGVRAPFASRFLKDHVATSDSHVVSRMKAAGLAMLGVTNAPENGWSIATEPVLYGAALNPWDAGVTPGGSSGGSAAAVASGMVPLAESTDGAGSIRAPAACCGVVGLKPTRGRVSAAPFGVWWVGGAYGLCNSRSVRDTAAYLDAVSGSVPGDPYPIPSPPEPFLRAMQRDPGRLRVGFTVTAPGPVDAEVIAAVHQIAHLLQGAGHHVHEQDMGIDLLALWQTYTAMSVVEPANFWSYAETLVGRPVTAQDVEPITWAILQQGRAVRAVDHVARVESLRQSARQIVQNLHALDIYITPTLTQPPRPKGHYNMGLTDLAAYNALWTDAIFLFPFNISGQPAMSLPLGQFANGLPLGIQIIARQGQEALLLSVARFLEQAMPWANRHPPVSAWGGQTGTGQNGDGHAT